MPAVIDPIRTRALDGVRHGFLGREGGVSTGLYASLNVGLGTQDLAEAVATNRRRALDAVAPGAALVTCYQVHSANVVTVTAPTGDRPQGDALVTDRPGIALGILTADCAPVLLADLDAGVVGAAHAGWKGALAGVTDRTLDAMEALGADRTRVVAAIGPCIARRSYEVDAAFRDRFTDDDRANARFFAESGARHRFDLEAYVAHRLAAAGVRHVEATGLDTYADEPRFFSYRRTTHRGEPDYGRQIAIVAL
jgi:polyphenol oxidase